METLFHKVKKMHPLDRILSPVLAKEGSSVLFHYLSVFVCLRSIFGFLPVSSVFNTPGTGNKESSHQMNILLAVLTGTFASLIFDGS